MNLKDYIKNYNIRLFIYLLIIFVIFAAIMVSLQYSHEKKIRLNALNHEMSDYTVLINNYLLNNSISKLDSLNKLIAKKHFRITIIDFSGLVIYDNQVSDLTKVENHANRPEIQNAAKNKWGFDIRTSNTTNQKYYYLAQKYSNYYIRVSVLYNIETQSILNPDKYSLIVLLLVFFIAVISVVLITEKFGKSIIYLKEFTEKASENKPVNTNVVFPETHLGEIGQKIIDIYSKLNAAKEELANEKDKLIRHLNILDEGISIFSKEKQAITYNRHFVKYLNLINDSLVYTAEEVFIIAEFEPVCRFLKNVLELKNTPFTNRPTFEIQINKNAKTFMVICNVYQDYSFEILVNDITKQAKQRTLKQQITDNIAHELKTPVSSIKGFLETLQNNNIDKQKQQEFIKRAYSQSCRLTDLINDISLLTKIEEAKDLYPIEIINLTEIINSVIDDVQLKSEENAFIIENKISDKIEINGNQVLIYSIFRNLIDNALLHAGLKIKLSIKNYMEDIDFVYFSVADNGKGIPEEDIPRIFERFYRVDKGRDRKSGGTGLGLAIVKNAVEFHKGEISVKNQKSGGLEFLFSLHK